MAAGPGSNPFASASLYVGDLLPEVTEATLFELFNAVGPVASIRVCRDTTTRKSLGYAYVNFHSVEDAERALDTMNFTNIKGKQCRIMWSQRDPQLRKSGKGNVFVKNLHESIDNKTLYDTFSVFGSILSCKVVTDETGKSKKFGYVHYVTEEAAKKAIAGVNGMEIQGQKVTTEIFLSREERAKLVLTVRNVPPKMTEDELTKLIVEKINATPDTLVFKKHPKHGTFAKVRFSESSKAEEAVKALKDVDVAHYYDGDEKEEESRPRLLEAVPAVNLNNVYVKYIPEKMDDDELVVLFEKETGGKVDSKKCWTHPFGKCACLNFKDTDSAEKAVKLLNGYDLSKYEWAKTLFVAFAQKRRDRQKLAAQRGRRGATGRFPGVNLYVKNIGPEVDDQALLRMFQGFGKITSAKVMRDPNTGKSRGFGFVCFQFKDHATKALVDMNSKDIGGKPLYVSRAQRKAQRQAFLQKQVRQRQYNQNMMYSHRPPQTGFPPQAPPPYFNPAFGARQPMPPMAYQPQPMARPPFGYPLPIPQQMPMAPFTRQIVPTNLPFMSGAPPGPASTAQQSIGAPAPATASAGMAPRIAPPVGTQSMSVPRSGVNPYPPQAPTTATAAVPSQASQPTAQQHSVGHTGQGTSVASHKGNSAPVMEQNPLTPQMLSNAQPAERKRLIGERLFPKIQEVEPRLAGKITGMLLEMDNTELLVLLDKRDALMKKINEALGVLKDHQMRQSQHNQSSNQNLTGSQLNRPNPGSAANQ